MILVREYEKKDLEAIKRIHGARAMGYPLVDAEDSNMMVKAVLENGSGPEIAVFVRETAEVYLMVDPQLGRLDAARKLVVMHREVEEMARELGLKDAHCWVSPQTPARFTKVLMRLGWQKALWPSYVLNL